MKALTFSSFGDSSVLEYREIDDPKAKSDEILVEMKAIGLNFADIYRRKGAYHLKGSPPYIAGYEGAGIVVETSHPEFRKGARVAFADVPFANAELVAVPVTHAIPLPSDISFDTAASALLQGLTAQYLATDSHKTQRGETVLIHSSAGGVGQILIQISKLLGAKVIGLTSSENKRVVSLSKGADAVFLYAEDWKESVMKFTAGRGVDVAYDGVGSTLMSSFEVTGTCGQVVFYGMSGGDPQPVDPRMLMDTSKTITGGDLWNYLTSRDERISRSHCLFQWITQGLIAISRPTVFKLSEGKQAHEYLESRASAGKIILIP